MRAGSTCGINHVHGNVEVILEVDVSHNGEYIDENNSEDGSEYN